MVPLEQEEERVHVMPGLPCAAVATGHGPADRRGNKPSDKQWQLVYVTHNKNRVMVLACVCPCLHVKGTLTSPVSLLTPSRFPSFIRLSLTASTIKVYRRAAPALTQANQQF